jgi:hypothetical protein
MSKGLVGVQKLIQNHNGKEFLMALRAPKQTNLNMQLASKLTQLILPSRGILRE